jgi:dipeptidyl aminopeptidase/acylaminoacyl peptidase
MMADGSSKVQLTTDGNLKGAPKWSPKGDRIAYTSELTGDMEVYVMNEDGSQQRQITEGHSPENFVETQIIWYPDGERLYWKVCIFPLPPFTTTIIPDDVAFVEIHKTNVDTGKDKILTPKLHEAIHRMERR